MDIIDNQALEIYKLYPRKIARPIAIKAIEKALYKIPYEELKGKVILYAKICSLRPKSEWRFIPHPTTWFNQERWDDDTEIDPLVLKYINIHPLYFLVKWGIEKPDILDFIQQGKDIFIVIDRQKIKPIFYGETITEEQLICPNGYYCYYKQVYNREPNPKIMEEVEKDFKDNYELVYKCFKEKDHD